MTRMISWPRIDQWSGGGIITTIGRCSTAAMRLFVAALLLLPGAGSSAAEPGATGSAAAVALDRLVAAYPDHLAGHDGTVVLWRDGTRMPWDDGKGDKDFETLLASPDIEDQFRFPYPLGRQGLAPPRNVDPGRIRHEPFFRKMYGDCRKGDVTRRLVDIVWLPRRWGKTVKVTSVNGVAERLQAVSHALDALPDRFLRYLRPLAGTYNCRAIAGTDRLSMHAYGAAIDLNVAHAHYWRWARPDATGAYPYRNAIPWEIVEIFEAHGFIWGGKWHHYDTMHFEYRPELILAGKR